MKVFLSSTAEDLGPHRVKVREALDMLRHSGLDVVWVGMEAFAASLTATSLEVALRELSLCDVYVGILGPRYGSIPVGYEDSFVSLEYKHAVQRKMHRALFLMETSCAEWQSVGHEQSRVEREKLVLLRQAFEQDLLLDYFDSPGDLAMKVIVALLPGLISSRDSRLAEPLGMLSRRGAPTKPFTAILTAAAAVIASDGSEASTVTARIVDAAGNNCDDGEPILWTVAGAATANPVYGNTRAGMSSTVVSPLLNQDARLYVSCVAVRLGVTNTIAVDLVAARAANV